MDHTALDPVVTKEEKIKFTVIVPTRERSDTLVYCLKTIVAQDYDNLEIIVSDNFSRDDTEEVVRSFADSRIRYINTGRRISMSHNWEFALSHVGAGWVMFIGDDDGLLPWALGTLDHVIRQSGCEALSTVPCPFVWPGPFASPREGALIVPVLQGRLYSLRNSKEMLAKVLGGRARYQELPWLYNGGAASIHVINRTRAADGTFFRSLCPDVYSSIALSLGTETYAFVEVPVAINGASRHSGGMSMLKNTENAEGTPASKFLLEENIPFHEKLVLGKSIQLAVYESYLQSHHLYESPITSLEFQLETALVSAPRMHKSQITTDCAEIARQNKLRLPSSLRIFIKSVPRRIESVIVNMFLWRVVRVSATDLRINDVHAACVAASNIHGTFQAMAGNNILSRTFARIFLFSVNFAHLFIRTLARYRR